mgnify:CR=1 FL=1
MLSKGIHLPNSCGCDRLHIWTDCTLFGEKDNWDCYYTVVLDDEEKEGLGHRAECVHPGELWEYVGIGNHTSNEGEYSGVIAALRWALKTNERVHVITDSNLIDGHVRRGWYCKATLIPYRDKVLRLLIETDAVLEWKPRQYNKAGWYNDKRLKERARDKRERERAQQPVRHRRQRSTKEQQVERRRMAYAERNEDAV